MLLPWKFTSEITGGPWTNMPSMTVLIRTARSITADQTPGQECESSHFFLSKLSLMVLGAAVVRAIAPEILLVAVLLARDVRDHGLIDGEARVDTAAVLVTMDRDLRSRSTYAWEQCRRTENVVK